MATPEVVQVAFGRVDLKKDVGGHVTTYTYLVPEGTHAGVGDVVVVPGNWAFPDPHLATIVARGRGDYDGPLDELLGVVITGYHGYSRRLRASEAGLETTAHGPVAKNRTRSKASSDDLQERRIHLLEDLVKSQKRRIERLEIRAASAVGLTEARRRIERVERRVGLV